MFLFIIFGIFVLFQELFYFVVFFMFFYVFCIGILYNKTLKVDVRLLAKSFQRLFFVLPDDLRGSDLA